MLLGQLRARIDELPRRRAASGEDPDLAQILAQHRADAFARLFGSNLNAKGSGPSGRAVDELRGLFDEKVRAVVDDRNRNRAHKFERLNATETSGILGVTELAERFTYLEGFLNDLLLLSRSATYSYKELNWLPAARAVPPMIDLILLGRAVVDRGAVYESLHATDPADESRPDDAPEILFNDYSRIRRALNRPSLEDPERE